MTQAGLLPKNQTSTQPLSGEKKLVEDYQMLAAGVLSTVQIAIVQRARRLLGALFVLPRRHRQRNPGNRSGWRCTNNPGPNTRYRTFPSMNYGNGIETRD